MHLIEVIARTPHLDLEARRWGGDVIAGIWTLVPVLVDALVERHTVELPESFLEHSIADAQQRKRFFMMQIGMDAEAIETSLEESKDADAEAVRTELKGSLILEQIAEVEGIQVTEDAVDARITQIAHRQQRWPNEVRGQLEQDGSIDNLRRELQLEKTRGFLREKAKIQELDAPPPVEDENETPEKDKVQKSEAS